MKRLGQVLIAIAGVGLASDVRGIELLTNGSFESPAISGNDQQFSAPSIAISGWVLTERTVDINRTSSIFGTAHSGNQMVDINGQNNGTLEQAFLTSPGQPYRLRLYYANNPNASMASSVYNADVTLSGIGELYTEFLAHSGSTSADMDWTYLTHMFVANSSITTLQLRSRMLGFNGVVFDSVSVQSVPEPSTCLGLMSLGLVLVWRGRRS